ncbi:unnamed protein product [Somion occarium]|uniref:Cytochrome P450 n=1 Tax=Somion occarium TaxID=3059160 RepID=A0ABP1DAB8_9APHY
MTTEAIGLLFIFLLWISYRLRKVGSREQDLPPGPPTVAIIGNLDIFPTVHPYLKLTEWAKAYGDIYSLKLGPKTVVVVSSPRAVRECIDLRGSTMSGRPYMYGVELIYGDAVDLVLVDYGPTWKALRRTVRDALSGEACMRHLPIQHAEATQLMYDFLENPQNFYTHIYSIVEDIDNDMRLIGDLVKPGGTPPIELIPILRYIPERWAPWKAQAREVRALQRRLYFGLLDLCIDRVDNEKRNGCFIEDVLDHQEEYGLDYEKIAYLIGTLMVAGADTTAVYLRFFVACMATYSDVQARAQQEIDSVIGSSRTPEVDDIDSLPFLKAVINEVHRFRPTAPLAIPHTNTVDERIGNFVIPKDSTILLNVWGIYRHEDYFENPNEFLPDRYMRSEYGTKPGVDTTGLRNDYGFGAGRRICPGMHLANNSIILNVMNFLWAFNFNVPKDSVTGEPIAIDLDNNTLDLTLGPNPYECDIKPRSEAKANMIRARFAAAGSTFALFDNQTTVNETSKSK